MVAWELRYRTESESSMKLFQGSATEILDLTTQKIIKYNGAYGRYCYDVKYNTEGAGATSIECRAGRSQKAGQFIQTRWGLNLRSFLPFPP